MIYTYNWKQSKDPRAHDLDLAVEQMARGGFNFLYVGGVADTDLWRRLLDLCAQYHIAVVPQLDFAYLSSPSQDVNQLVARAVPFIKKYKEHPAVVAFSVREEPSLEIMPALKQYFEGILREVPDAPLHLLHNQLPTLEHAEPPHPQIIGTDRYPFWWEFGSGGHRATPRYALHWYRSQLDRYYQLAAGRGAEFQAVFTASTLETVMAPEQIRKSFYPASVTDAFREQSYRRIAGFAASTNQGWAPGPVGNFMFWKYYRPPANCVRAMAWLAVAEGARSLANWAWAPPHEDRQDFAHRAHGRAGHEYTCSITGWDGQGTPQLEEYSAFAKDIRPYGKLIRAMTKEYSSVRKLPSGQERAAGGPAAAPVFAVAGEDVGWSAFQVEGFSGRVILVVNTQVGQWCEGRSPTMLSPKDTYRIDEQGNLMDYEAFDQPRALPCRILAGGLECVDLATGSALKPGADGAVSLPVLPGGGHFLFLSPGGSGEWDRLKQRFDIQAPQ
jgi:hypothetical protein